MNLVWWLTVPIIYVLTWICSWRASTIIEIVLLSFLFIIPLLVDLLETQKAPNPRARLLRYYERVIETGVLLLVSIVPWQLDTRANDAIFIKTVFVQAIIFTIAVVWFLRMLEERSFTFIKMPINIPILVFWWWCIITLLTSQYKYASMEELYRFVSYFLIFFIMLNNIKERAQVWRIVTTLMISAFIIAVYGVFQHFGYDFVSWASQARIPASLGNPDFYSGFLCVTIPIGAGLMFATKSTFSRTFYGILTFLQLLGLYYTLTRGGWAAMLVAIPFFILLKIYTIGFRNFFSNKTLVRIMMIFAAVIAGMVAVLFLYKPLENTKNRLTSTLSFGGELLREAPQFLTYVKPYPAIPSPQEIEDGGNIELLSKEHIYRNQIEGTAGVRVTIWTGSWRMFLETPFTMIFGQGLGTYRQTFPPGRPPYYRFKTVSHNTEHAHCEYFEILSEQGAVGLILFFWIVFVFFRKRTKLLFTPDRWKQNLLIGINVAVFAILFENMGSVNLRWTSCAPFFWIAVALGMVVSRLPDRPDLNGIKPIIDPNQKRPDQRPKGKQQQQQVKAQQQPQQEKKKPIAPEIKTLSYVGSAILLIFLYIQVLYPFLADINLRNGNLCRDVPQDWDRAVGLYKQALKYEPTNIEVPYKLAYIYAQKKQWADALNTYMAISRMAPNYTQIHYNFGITYYNLGQVDKATEEFEKTVRYDWSNDVGFLMLGVCYVSKKEWDKAINAFQCASVARRSTYWYLDRNISPYYPAAYLNLGNIYYRLGKIPEAVTEYESVLRVDPTNPDAAARLEWIKTGKTIKWE